MSALLPKADVLKAVSAKGQADMAQENACSGKYRLVALAVFVLHRLLFRGAQLRGFQLDGELVESAVELERRLVVLVFDARAGVGTDIEAFVHAEGERDSGRDLSARHFLSVDREHSRAAFGEPRSIVFEVEGDDVLAGRQRLRACETAPH